MMVHVGITTARASMHCSFEWQAFGCIEMTLTWDNKCLTLDSQQMLHVQFSKAWTACKKPGARLGHGQRQDHV